MLLHSADLDSVLNLKFERLAAKWVHRLNLRDWKISWRIVRKADLRESTTGSCESLLLKKIATIKVLHPDDADPSWFDAGSVRC